MGSAALHPTREVTCRAGCHGMERHEQSQRQLALQVWHGLEGPDWLLQQNPTVREKEGDKREETPRPGPPESSPCLPGSITEPGCAVRVTAQLVLCASSQHPPAAPDPHRPGRDMAPTPSTNPPCLAASHAGKRGDHRAGEGSWACPTLARALRSGRAPGWLVSPSGGGGWRG